MNNRIKLELYYKDIMDCDFEIAHLYEHLRINGFYKELCGSGKAAGLWGWLTGETFIGASFLAAGFYDNNVGNKFVQYLEKPLNATPESIDKTIACLEAENEVEIAYDPEEVVRQLDILDKKKYVKLSGKADIAKHVEESHMDIPKSKYLVAKSAKKNFQDFSVKIGIENPTDIEKEIFLRLGVIVSDIVANVLENLSAYMYHSSGPLFNKVDNDFIYSYMELTINKDRFNEKAMQGKILGTLGKVNLLAQRKGLRNFIKKYYTGGSAVDFPIDYYRSTGVLSSKYHTYKVFTSENVQMAWNKLKVVIEKK